MSREILFRAKRIDNGEWVEGFYFLLGYDGASTPCIGIEPLSANDYGEIYRDCYCEIDPATLCQYTDLTDKNGVKIFEGDILGEQGYCFTVVYDHERARFKLQHDDKAIQYPEWNRGVMMEIIGNIHDRPHPDLLLVKEK